MSSSRISDRFPASAWSGWVLPATFVAVGAFAWACQDLDGGSANDPLANGEVTRRDVLDSIAHQVVVPATAEFAGAAATLQTTVEAWAAQPDGEAELAAAQQAWIEASAKWQGLEMLQIGPAAASLVGVGGEDLRDAIYSWPTTDTCSVDRAVVAEDYAASDFFETSLVWVFGLDALEYLLFAHGEAHTCPDQVQLDAGWDALGFEEIERRRAAYALVLAGGIAATGDDLATRWSPSGGDFAGALAAPGEGDSPYESDVQALDEVFRAMFYLDKQVKDGKLAVPLGLLDGCTAVPCLEMMEAPHAGVGVQSIRENLAELRLMITGGPDRAAADGFDDLLRVVGEPQIADELLAAIDAAIAIADELEGSPQELTLADPDALVPLHDAIRRVTTTLKGPFTMALMLTIPVEGAGDAD